MLKLNIDESSIIVSDYRDTLVSHIPTEIRASTVISKEPYHRGYKVTINGMIFWNVSIMRWNGLPENAPAIKLASPKEIMKDKLNTGTVIE